MPACQTLHLHATDGISVIALQCGIQVTCTIQRRLQSEKHCASKLRQRADAMISMMCKIEIQCTPSAASLVKLSMKSTS